MKSDFAGDNLVELFLDRAGRLADRPFLWAADANAYKPMTWRQVSEGVQAAAAGLIGLGVEPGDRIMLVSENRPEWLIADLAIMAAGAITVPAFTTSTRDDYHHILENSGATGVIISSDRLAKQVLPAVYSAASHAFVVSIEPVDLHQQGDVPILLWDDLIVAGQRSAIDIAQRAASISSDDVACLIYTSGTGGAPKGVMLDHGAILHNCRGAVDALPQLIFAGDRFLSILPLSHAYEHTAGQFLPLYLGAEIFYAEGLDALARNMVEVKPTVILAVPRLLDVIRDRMLRALTKASATQQRLFQRTLAIGLQRLTAPKTLGLFDRLLDPLLTLLVRRKVGRRFGGRLKALVAGGAPLNPEVGGFFAALGVTVLQGYGQTEAAPLISVNRFGGLRLETVGPPIVGVEVVIADDGEILVRGRSMMRGYWGDPEATADVIKDGWLHTGDVGVIEADGHIKITDRKKDLIVNSGGDNISPGRVESMLCLQPEIAQAMVYGDRRPHLVALLVPDEHWMIEWARKHRKPVDLEVLRSDPAFRRALTDAVDRINSQLSILEKVRRFLVAHEPFSVDNGEMTPTLKVRRHVLRRRYEADLEQLYA